MDKEEEPGCHNCKFYKRHVYSIIKDVADYGHCRRYPPRRLSEEESAFPMVTDDTHCGEWRQKT